ncbi:MAG: hypothetical protein PHV74_11110 [Dehalococcoidia bacterium]|nr:hypothetical protein [Dehalococcoidia bacterium]
MEIETLRDWVIVISGILGIGVTLILFTLFILIYRKITHILDSADQAVGEVRETASTVSKTILQPIVKVQGFVAGVRKAVAFLAARDKKN